jgi:hypothetical protein
MYDDTFEFSQLSSLFSEFIKHRFEKKNLHWKFSHFDFWIRKHLEFIEFTIVDYDFQMYLTSMCM